MNEPTDRSRDPEAMPAAPMAEGAIPPLLLPDAPHIPPVLVPAPVTPTAPPPPTRPSLRLQLIAAAVGLVQLGLAFAASATTGSEQTVGYRLGYVVGSTAFWPLIFIGLFSIGRSFRTARTRLTIFSIVWGIFILAHLSTLGAARRPRAAEKPRPTAAQVSVYSVEPAPPAAPPVERSATSRLPAEADPVAAFDFSPGSDQRLIALIDAAQNTRYREVAEAYARACTLRPGDATLALERVRFIDRFAFSEDNPVEEAATDREVAVDHLTSRFPEEPGTVLYLLGQEYGEELEAKATGYLEAVMQWPPAQRAEFFLLRAHAIEATDAAGVLGYARESFRLHATAEAGILLAEKAHAAGLTDEALAVLSHEVFDRAEPWLKKRKMDLLFEAKRPARAFGLYEQLKQDQPHLVLQPDTARHLADAGRIDAAREVLAGLTVNDWNRPSVLRSRFDFELRHGDANTAETAYREFRSTGIAADPFLRDRLALLLRHLRAAWALADLVGAGLLGLLLLAVALSPLVLLIPIHYWSLLRARKGKTASWPGTRWGLRQAWMTSALMLLSEAAALWLWQPELLRSWTTNQELAPPLSDQNLIWQQTLAWTVLGATLLLLLWRARAWRLLGPGEWRIGQALGYGLLATLALRAALMLYSFIVPETGAGATAALSSQTQQLCLALVKAVGPIGLIAVIAVLVPLLEEVFFRGVLLQAFGRHIPFGWANSIQAVLFALVHEEYRLFPFYFVFGITCGLLARRSGGLLTPLIVHASNNFLAAIGLLLLQRHFT